MRYWILILAVLASPGIFAQEAADTASVPEAAAAETAAEEAVETGLTTGAEAVEAGAEAVETEAEMVPPEPTPVLHPPMNVKAEDVPDDNGGVVVITWEAPIEGTPSKYFVEIAGEDGFYRDAGKTFDTTFTVSQLENFKKYTFRVQAVYESGTAISEASEPVEPMDHFLKLGEIPVLAAIIIFASLLIVFVQAARRGVELFVRRISGLTAVEDAIGRATEMGKPVLYVPGTSTIEDVATLASLNILGEVARRTVHYDVKIICPNKDPIVYTIAREIVKETYASEGRPDAFDPNSVFYMVPDQFAFAAGVDGIMVREKPATIFLMGMFWAESLIMAETGASTGAIQIAGTDSVAQLPFFITACDYTLIGEELYAASAYLGREPMLLGTLKAQDYGKLVFLGLMILFTLISLLSGIDASEWVRVR